jgi:hypothetical protein
VNANLEHADTVVVAGVRGIRAGAGLVSVLVRITSVSTPCGVRARFAGR